MIKSEYYYAFKFLEARNIRVYSVAVNNVDCVRICVERSGIENVGHQVYKSTAFKMQKEVVEYGIKRKVTVTIPPVHKAIEQLVIQIFRENGGDKTPGHLYNNRELIRSLYDFKKHQISIETIIEGLFYIHETTLEAFKLSRKFTEEVKKLTLEIYEKINEKTHVEASKIAS